MIRCPFNNFSKCDGSCPFSTENFKACKLASLLVAIEGLGRGTVAQLATANAHLVEAKELMAKEPAATQGAAATGSRRLNDPRTYIKGRSNGFYLYLSKEASEQVRALGWEACSFELHRRPRTVLYVFEGDSNKITVATTTERLRVVLPKAMAAPILGDHRTAFMSVRKDGDELVLEPTGEVVD